MVHTEHLLFSRSKIHAEKLSEGAGWRECRSERSCSVSKKLISKKKNGIFSHVLWLSGMEIICYGEPLINVSDS